MANTATLDDHGTIIEPEGARFSLPIPLLWHHDQETPVGEITHAELRGGKWHVRGSIRKVTEPGKVKDATDAAWHNVKYQLVRGLSIGFRGLKQKGNRFLEWALREISLVTIPSNSDASILAVRAAYVAASGDPEVPASRAPNHNPRPKTMLTVQEQITQHENSRAAKVAQRDALLAKAAEEGRTLDESESESFDTLDTEIRSIDQHLTRLSSVKADTEKRATPVEGTSTKKASESRGSVSSVSVKPNTAPGLGFARHVMSLAVSHGNRYEAAQYARRTWGDSAEEVVAALENGLTTRAAVAAGTTTNATFAAPLVTTNFANEFLELLRPATLIGRVPGLRRVPFNTSMPAQTAGGTYAWVGQGAGKPVTNAQYATVTLSFAKAAGIIVLTEELVRLSTPSAQEAVRDEMVKGATQFLDGQFIDPAVAAVANVNPASITNGVAGTAATAATAAAARSDIAARIAAFATANFDLGGLVILMSEAMAFNLGMMVNDVGDPAFPGLRINGGTILGIPVVTSGVITNQIIFVHAPSVLIADEGGVEVDVSREATLILDSAPDSVVEPAAGAAPVHTSLWQRNLVGIRAERWITWGKARSTAVDRITGAAYVP